MSCKLFKHTWVKWSELLQTYDGHKQQWRVCTCCNKAQFRTLFWDRQTELEDIKRALKSK